jgi:hypothetical protein
VFNVTRAAVLLVFAVSLLAFSAESDAVRADPLPVVPPKIEPKKGGFEGRTKEGKARLLKEFGGSIEGEEAVMLGLAWLVQVQKKEGNWQYDQGHTTDLAAATGMAVLAFTGAGQSHKDGRYKQTMQAAIDWLVGDVDMGQGAERGKFRSVSPQYMYSQGIATLALVEAYGLTHDPKLRPAAQAAIDFIQKAQGPNGSWGYSARQNGDTSIVGWQIQALHAAQLTQDLVVDPKVIERAIKFLNHAGTGQNKSAYGYGGPGGHPATALTAIGLLCRYYVDGWRSNTPGFAEGAKGLMQKAVAGRSGGQLTDLYYFYYATQVVRFYGGEEWKTWNEGPLGRDGKRKGGMPGWLLSLQVKAPTNRGSWNPENGWFGHGYCGRLGTTCMCLLTLEVYYRYTPENEQSAKEKP